MTRLLLVAAVILATMLLASAASVASAEDDLICGQAKVIRATIRDGAGNPVSDRTRVEFVTNYGGVLAGTGATLDPLAQGYVQPLSSTVAETFDGVATVTLLTSTEHVGPYEVVIAAGSWNSKLYQAPVYAPGSLTPMAASVAPVFQYQTFGASYPITAQITVTCRAA